MNDDGIVDVLDVIILAQIAFGLVEPTPDQAINGDLNRDGVIDVQDITLAMQHGIGLGTITDCGPPEPDTGLPPDPTTSAPSIDPTVATTISSATEFLYTGPNPIQTGVDPGAFEPVRAAVLRGQVLTREEDPLTGVAISVLNHPEFGQTLSRDDGMFDLAVNGGGLLTLSYHKEGFLPAQRQAQAPWQDFAWLPDVVMAPLDPQVTVVDLTADVPVQVAQGSVVTDDDGQRQATVLVPQGTQAELVLPDGTTQPLTSLSIRATEYSVGDNGPQAMPAELPATSGYTYAVEFSVDEAIAAGATRVDFSQPLPFYVENFLALPVGGTVPSGYYDRQRGQWIASDNGLIVAIVDITGGLAELDLNGDGQANSAEDLAALGITDAEREELAQLYAVGQSLWRVPISHFTPWDCNWPYGPPTDADPPSQDVKKGRKTGRAGRDCLQQGSSSIECRDMLLGERVGVAGAPFTLNYRSDRVPGRVAERSIDVPLTGDTIHPLLVRVELEILVAGQRHTWSFPAQPNLIQPFTWDGLDAYGRPVQGAGVARVRIGYVYPAVYLEPAEFQQSFARLGGTPIVGSQTRQEVTIWQVSKTGLLPWDARGQGLGGWTVDVHHAYDFTSQALRRGDGTSRSVDATNLKVITTFAGTGQFGFLGDGGPATQARLARPFGVEVGPDGSVYIAESNGRRVRRVDPDGIIITVAGGGTSSGEGIPATEAGLSAVRDVAVAPDGSLYLAVNDGTIKRVDLDGIITTFAGGGASFEDGVPATEARLLVPRSVAVGPDGSVYIADLSAGRVRRVGPDGIITTVAGGGFSFAEGVPAVQSRFPAPQGVAVGPDGSLYISDSTLRRVRRVGPDGIITTVVGGGPTIGDGIPATQVRLTGPEGVAVGLDGIIYVADFQDPRIRRVTPDGIITTVAGIGLGGFSGDGGPATQARIGPGDVAVGPDDRLYVATPFSDRVRLVAGHLPGFTASDFSIASQDGRQLFRFDQFGKHLETRSTLTGATLYSFAYDDQGRLATVTDGDGNVTTIQRDAEGNPSAIIAPFGQRTELEVNEDGYLTRIANPANEAHTMTYGPEGLLSGQTDPRGSPSFYSYDELGRLVNAQDRAGNQWTLTASRTPSDGYRTVLTSPLGRATTYETERLPTGDIAFVTISPSGGRTESVVRQDSTYSVTHPDGTVYDVAYGPDPRWGMQSPLFTITVTTPGGVTTNMTADRTVDLADPVNPLSLVTLEDTLARDGAVHRWTYDAAERRYTARTPTGRESVQALDEQERIISSQEASGVAPTTFTYDERGLLQEMRQGNRSWSLTYDALGRTASGVDALGNETTYAYDAADRVTDLTLPDDRQFGFTYDANGNQTGVVMPSGAVHTQQYDDQDLFSGYAPSGDPGFSRNHTPDREWSQTDLASGRTVVSQYDAGGRPTGLSYPEATTDFAYAGATDLPAGFTRTPDGAGGAQEVTYDYDGQLPVEMAWDGVATGAFSYTYDDFFLKQIALDGVPIQLTYDLDAVLTGFGRFSIQRDGPQSAPSSIADDALDLDYSYDVDTTEGGTGNFLGRAHQVNGEAIYQFDLSYDELGRIVQRDEMVAGEAHSYQYEYDVTGRLVDVTLDGGIQESYAYDGNDNRTSRQIGDSPQQTATYDEQDRLTSLDGVAYQFDADGFLTSRGADTFGYSSRGELLSVTVGGQTITYAYDGLGRRTGRADSDGTHQYLYGNPENAFQVTAVRDPEGVLTTLFYDPAGILFALERNSQWYYVAADQVGTPRVVADATGAVVKVLEYDSSGVLLTDSNPSFYLPLGFAGGLSDPATGLVRFGFRDYEPASGRWTARDPALFDGGQANLYAYARNNPVSNIDPTGLACFGFSAFFYLGGGFRVCLTPEGFSACRKKGIGYGGGFEVNPFQDLDETGAVVRAEVSGVLIFAGAELGAEIDDCGEVRPVADCSIGPIGCFGDIAIGESPSRPLRVGLKVQSASYYEDCKQWRW